MSPTQENSENGLFDENRIVLRQKRALARNSDSADFLAQRIGEDFAFRIGSVNRQFQNVADMFSLFDVVSRSLNDLDNVTGIARYEIPQVHEQLAQKSRFPVHGLGTDFKSIKSGENWPNNLDLVVCALGMHAVNDLPVLLGRILRSMKEDAMLMLALPLNGTLKELRECLTRAESELSGGASARIEPFIDLQQAGKLLQNVGFKLPVVDREELTIRYDNMMDLVQDLRSMGATSALRTNTTAKFNRELFRRAAQIYQEEFSDGDGRIRASFCYANLTAWSPHSSQQQPLKPGSAQVPLARVLKA